MRRIETETLILGGGWSGLVAASLLSARGSKSVLLEREAELGGLARTFTFNGFKFDVGGHRLFFKKKENLKYLEGLFRSRGLLNLKKKSKIHFNGRYIDHPVTISSVLGLDRRLVLKILCDHLRSNGSPSNGCFEAWIKANYGDTLFRIFFKDYTEKVWGLRCNALSSDWAEKRIGKGDLFKFIKDIFIEDGSLSERARRFFYPQNGMTDLINSLHNAVRKDCATFTGCQLKQFLALDGRLNSLAFTREGQQTEVFFKRVVSTIPVTELCKSMAGILNGHLGGVSEQIRYRSLVIASVILKRSMVSDWHWCYFPSSDVAFSRLHEPKLWSRALAPSDDRTLVCAEIFCNYDDEQWRMSDEGYLKATVAGLQKIGLVRNDGDVEDICVKRFRYAYPLLYDGYDQPLGVVKNKISSFGNIYFAGRNGGHTYYDMEECLEDLRRTVGKICDGGFY